MNAMIGNSSRKSLGTEFVECLRENAGLKKSGDKVNRHLLADLRRGAGKSPGEAPHAFSYVVGILSDPGVRPWRTSWVRKRCEFEGTRMHELLNERVEDACFDVATLFALHPSHQATGNLGASFRLIRPESRAGARKGVKIDAVERRFRVLLDADAEDLPDRLRSAVSLLGSKNVPINYATLLDDLLEWRSPRRRVQRKWAEGFWEEPRPFKNEEEGDPDPTEIETTDATETEEE